MKQSVRYYRLFALTTALFTGTMLQAQDYDKIFEDFNTESVQSFEQFKNKADSEFESFLRESWKAFEAQPAIPVPSRPEPPKPVVFDKNAPTPPISKIKVPEKTSTPTPQPPVVPIVPPKVEPTYKPTQKEISFYGNTISIDIAAILSLKLQGISENDIADAWKEVCKRPYEKLISDCIAIKEQYDLPDWGYLLLTHEIGEQLYSKNRSNEITFMQMFILCKSGYKAKLAKIDNRLKLMVATDGTIYATPYLRLDGDKYYVYNPTPNCSNQIYTYRKNFSDAKNQVSLAIRTTPKFAAQDYEREISATVTDTKGKEQKVTCRTRVNTNLIHFFADYPQCDVPTHYRTPLSTELEQSLYPTLKELISGKTQADAANLLLTFVQNAFSYQTDDQQFGYEKPFFADEVFYYPYCDCEDRAMLYSNLVSKLIGSETVLLDYPGHIASAVHFTETVNGDKVITPSGKEYLICDPTYIGAPIGRAMESYKSVSPDIIVK